MTVISVFYLTKWSVCIKRESMKVEHIQRLVSIETRSLQRVILSKSISLSRSDRGDNQMDNGGSTIRELTGLNKEVDNRSGEQNLPI